MKRGGGGGGGGGGERESEMYEKIKNERQDGHKNKNIKGGNFKCSLFVECSLRE